MHGQFLHNLDEKLVDKEQAYRWLKFGDIKGETERTIVAAQDQAINTNYFRKKILKQKQTVNADYVKNMRKQSTT
jgi:hypothetical protein